VALELVGRALSGAAAAPERKPARSLIALVMAGLLMITAVGLTVVGLVMNARFAASFGQTAEAAALLAAIGLAVDLLAVVLPSVSVQLWQRRSILAAASAWTLWLGVLAMTWLAATGFASTNIGDSVAGRAKIAGESAVLTERLGRLRQERAGIAEARPLAAIDVELQKAQPDAQSVWRITDGCRDVTRAASARACAVVFELRQARAAAERRDAIDGKARRAVALGGATTGGGLGRSAGDHCRGNAGVAQLRRGQPGAVRHRPAARARSRAGAVIGRADRHAGAVARPPRLTR
jgi:hypothetical protein